MSARSFRSVFMVGAIASAALGCYLVSLRVASERASLESVENRIALAQRDIRLLETEIGTRGRLAQLERWNVKVIRLSAPTADQFVEGAFQLATLAKPEREPAIAAPVVLASAPLAPRPGPAVTNDDDGADQPAPRASRPLSGMMHVASYSRPAAAELRSAPRQEARPVAPQRKASDPNPATAVAAKKPSEKASAAKLAPKSGVTAKPVKTATSDPLAPLSRASAPAKKSAPKTAVKATAKASATKESGSH